MREFAFLALVFAASAAFGAKDITIVEGGRRIVDLDPASMASNCSGWSYDAMPLRGDDGTISIIYSAGDALTDHCKSGLGSAARFGDRIWRHERQGDGTWSGSVVLSRDGLDWMNDDTYLAAHPEAFVGHLASPAVVRSDGRYVMAFAASVNDPNLCAGEHDAQNACGSCTDPWSYFTILWAASDDGVHWTLRKRDPSATNRALGASLLWRSPTSSDRVTGSLYKGITHVSMVRDRKYFYLMTQMWVFFTVKSVLFRVAADPSSPFGIGDADPEIWNGTFGADGQRWEVCPHGELPNWIAQASTLSINVFLRPLTSIATTSSFPGTPYIALAIGSGVSWSSSSPRNNRIEYQLSSDLIHWGPATILRSRLPFFADGRAYDNSVLAPAAAEDGDGHLHVFFASGDGDDDHGLARDGLRDCTSGAGPTTIFIGSGIYEATLDRADPVPTAITVEPKPSSVQTGERITFNIHVTSATGTPSGTAQISGGPYFAVVPVTDGNGVVTLPAPYPGDFALFGTFYSDATMWASSATPISVHVAAGPPRPKRRAARH